MERKVGPSTEPGRLIEAYRHRLPVEPDGKVVTLLEGGTPLISAPHLSELTGCEVYPQGRGGEPDRVVQGPHDDGGQQCGQPG